ncbi:hypothetical protein MMC22_007774 [Lobaria immixta]|nr:hypothetical protein [Lobaria immixta]
MSYSSDQFHEDWFFAVDKDFKAGDGTPANWAAGQPQYWGEEHARIVLPFPPSTVSLNADCTLLAVALEHDIYIYSTTDWSVFQILKGHVSRVDAMSFHPTERGTLVSCAMNDFAGSIEAEPTIIFWNLDDQYRRALLVESTVQELGKRAAESVASGLEESESSWAMEKEEREELGNSIGNAITVLNIKSQAHDNKKIHGRLTANFGSQIFNSKGTSMAILPGGGPASNGDDKWDICIWDTATNEVRLTLEGHRDAIMWVGFSPDDKLIASVSWDQTFRIWKHDTGDLLYTFNSRGQNWTGGFSKDSRLFAGTSGEGRFWIWDMAHGLEVATHEFGGDWCRALDWSPDGKQLVVGGQELGRLIVFDLKSQVKVQERMLSTEKCPEKVRCMMDQYLEVSSVQYLPGTHKIAFKTTGDQGLEVYDLRENKKWRFAPRQDENKDCGLEFLVLAHRGLIASVDGKAIRFWKVPFGEQS